MPRGNPALKLNNTPWPKERAQRLRQMLANGMTDRQIAEELDVTVRAVIGKRRRLGLMRWTKNDDALAMALRREQRNRE